MTRIHADASKAVALRTLLAVVSSLVAGRSQQLWRDPLDAIPSTDRPLLWFDPVRQSVTRFGGAVQIDAQAPRVGAYGFWNWHAGKFRLLPPVVAQNDIELEDPASADDLARSALVLFAAGYTYAWDGRRIVTRAYDSVLEDRVGVCLAFDPVRRGPMLIGGRNRIDGTLYGDTWHWQTNHWTRTTAVGPSPRAHAVAVADSSRDEVLLTGGVDSSGAVSDTWVWDGTAWHAVAGTSPPAQTRRPVMVHDTRRQRTLWIEAATFEWDGTAWHAAAAPPAEMASAVFDPVQGRTVAATAEPRAGDNHQALWTWDGVMWRQLWESDAARDGVMRTDTRRNEVLLLDGGAQAGAFRVFVLDDAAWRLVPVRGVTPPVRGGFAAAFDPVRDQIVLFGGRDVAGRPLGDTWLFDRALSTWTRVGQAGPPPQVDPGLEWDDASGGVICFGTTPSPQTWHWNGAAWSRLSPRTTPPAGPVTSTTVDGVSGAPWFLIEGQVWAFTSRLDWSPQAPIYTQQTLTLCGFPTARATIAIGSYGSVCSWDGTRWSEIRLGEYWTQWLSAPHAAFDAEHDRVVLHGYERRSSLWAIARGEAWMFESGYGCYGSLGEPVLLASHRPRVADADFALHLGRALPGAVALLIGGERTRLETCQLHVDPIVATLPMFPDANGRATQALPIPADAGLLGVRIQMQAVIVDPMGGFARALTATQGVFMQLAR